ncbi:hypothetical protein DSO57_1022673 [Entomophthora muscae]|uniref:Uncharacterized protein n=1 Tax=Entomophthora muscae TaxID=34485 RepID=A0ACC2SRY1_9FUNG|nr:hypothetical protein DSO57_1022673 [Entomophthora muscae]
MRVRSNSNKNIETGQAKATGFKPGTSGTELSASTNSGTQGLAHVCQRLNNNCYMMPTHELLVITIQCPAKHPCPANCQSSPPATSSAQQCGGTRNTRD